MFFPGVGSTVLYSVPYTKFNFYIENLFECSNHYLRHGPEGLERLLPNMCIPRNEINTLGVSGQVAVFNDRGESELYIA
jgi:hypothetical protein